MGSDVPRGSCCTKTDLLLWKWVAELLLPSPEAAALYSFAFLGREQDGLRSIADTGSTYTCLNSAWSGHSGFMTGMK